MQEKLLLIGIGLMFLGMFVTILAAVLSGSGKVEGGGIVFIGPFPIGFASSKKMMYPLLLISLMILIVFFILNKRLI